MGSKPAPKRSRKRCRLQNRFWVDFGSIFGRFWVDLGSIFGRIWDDFWLILGRFLVDFRSILRRLWSELAAMRLLGIRLVLAGYLFVFF